MTSPTGKEPINPYAGQQAGGLYVPYPNDDNIDDAYLPTLGKPEGHETEFAQNSEERCAVVLVLDTSNSMEGEPIKLLNQAVTKFHSNLSEDPLIAIKVDIGMVMFNHSVTFKDFINATEFQPPVMQASGGTNLSFALNVALDMVTKRKDVYRINGISYHRPWIVLITDGYPEHDSEVDLEATGQRIRTADTQRECSLFAITCGEANESVGSMLRDKITPASRPPEKDTRSQLQRII